MFKFFINPGKFIQLAESTNKFLIFFSIISLLLGITIVFLFSPNDYQQNSAVKIMYVHVPSAWISLMIFFIMTIYSFIALIFKIPFGFIVNKSIAPIGAIFTLVCIISGSLWGKPMWGTWWVWDARLTSVAVLLIIYLIIIFINFSFENKKVGEKIAAVAPCFHGPL